MERDDVTRMKKNWIKCNAWMQKEETKNYTDYVKQIEEILPFVIMDTFKHKKYGKMKCLAAMIDSRDVRVYCDINFDQLYDCIFNDQKVRGNTRGAWFMQWIQLVDVIQAVHIQDMDNPEIYDPYLLLVWKFYA